MTEGGKGRRSIIVGLVGVGYFGGGLLRRLMILDNFVPAIAANRTLDRALAAYQRSGVDPDGVVVTTDHAVAQRALNSGRFVATTDLLMPCALEGIDVIAEATGDLLVGTQVAVAAIAAGKHLVAANSDVHATVGPILKVRADRAGVVYSDIEGDEPGLLKDLFDHCTGLGLDVVVAANGKGVLKRYATPDTQAAFAAAHHLQPWLATAAADGTKLNFEMTVVANATGLLPARPGMHGPKTSLERLLVDFEQLELLDGGRYVDFALGCRGVFAVVRSDDPQVHTDFEYFKLGSGPHYVLHRPEVLAQYAAPLSIERAVRQGQPTVAPLGAPVAETIAFAKRDLGVGQPLDGIGGFDTYGMIVRADHARRDGLVPIGLVQYSRVLRPIPRDEPVTYNSIGIEGDNLALQLRREQDGRFFGSA